MKNLLIATLLCFACLPAYSQLNCNNVVATTVTNVYVNTAIMLNNCLPTHPAPARTSLRYTVNWGDNTSSYYPSFNSNFSHDYTAPGTYIITLKFEVYDSVYNIYCADTTSDTVVITPIDCSILKASMNASITGDKITLVNNSIPLPSYHINADYYIDWGDPTGRLWTSGYGPYTYTYKSSGTYNVKMVFTLSDPLKSCKDTVDTTISVIVIPPNQISGWVYTDSPLTGPNDTIKLWLIKYDSTTKQLSPVDSLLMAPIRYYLGYNFKNQTPGSYRLKAAIFGQPSSTGNIPTYHDSDLVWNKANIITHTGGNTGGMTLRMRTGKVTTGPGVIAGKVQNSYTSQGISGINVLLLEGSGLPVAYDVTDGSGDYSFSNLPIGTYYVHPEDLNYITTAASVVISNSNTSQTTIAFERIAGNKTIVLLGTGISGINNGNLQFAVYPNPAKNAVNISWTKASDDIADITITDISGKRVISTIAQMSSVATIGLDKLQPGLYFIAVATEDRRATLKLIIQ